MKTSKISQHDLAIVSHAKATGLKHFGKLSDQILVSCGHASTDTILPTEHRFERAKSEKERFTFIDLCAGIGGFRMALQNLGGKCLFSSEYDKFAQQTYMANYGELPFGDITDPQVKSLIPPKFDLLCAGFPCQPFSLAGVSKKKSW